MVFFKINTVMIVSQNTQTYIVYFIGCPDRNSDPNPETSFMYMYMYTDLPLVLYSEDKFKLQLANCSLFTVKTYLLYRVFETHFM